MDPKAVLNMVREQKKHINDAYNNTPSAKQQTSTSSLSNSSTASSLNNSSSSMNNNNNNSTNSVSHLFQQSSHSKSNSTNNNSNNYMNFYNNNNNNNNNISNNKRTDQLPVSMILPKTNFTSPTNNNQKIYNLNNNNEKINKILNSTSTNANNNNNSNMNNLQAHLNKAGFKQINDYYNSQSSSSCLAPPPPPPHSQLVNNNNSNTHYVQDLHSSINNVSSNMVNQMHQSRSGSAKSTASDSGVGSTSPLSDCSDYGANNNNNSNNNNQYNTNNQNAIAYQQRNTNDLNKQKLKLSQQNLNSGSSHILSNQSGANNNNSIKSIRDFQQYLANDPSAVFNSNNPYSFNNLNNEQISAIINSRKRKNNPATNVYDDFILNKYGSNILSSKYGNNNNNNNSPIERSSSSSVTNLNDNIKNINYINDIHHRNANLINNSNNNNNHNNNNTRIKCDDKCCTGCLINNGNNQSSNQHNIKSPINNNNNNNGTPIPPQILNGINKHTNNGINNSNLNMNNNNNKQMHHHHHQSLSVMGLPSSLQPPTQSLPPQPQQQQQSSSQFTSHCDCADCQISKSFNQKFAPSSSPLSQHIPSGLTPLPTSSSCDCPQCNAALLQQQQQQQLKLNHSRSLLMNNNNNNHNNHPLNNGVKHHSSSAHLNDFITNNKISQLESNKLSAFSTNNSIYMDTTQVHHQQQPPPPPPKKSSFCSCPQCEQHLLATGKLVQNTDTHNSKLLMPSLTSNNQHDMKLSNASTTQLANLLNQSHNNQSKSDLYSLNNKLISESKNLLSSNANQHKFPQTSASNLQYHQLAIKPQAQTVTQQPKIHKPVPIIASPIPIKPKLPYMLQPQQQQISKPVSDPHANYVEMIRNHTSHINNNNNNNNNGNSNTINNNTTTTTSTLSSNAVMLTHEYDEFMNNGLHITKLKNTFYNGGGSDNNNESKKEETERPSSSPSVVGKRKHSVESSSPSMLNSNNIDLNNSPSNQNDNSAKRVATMNYLMQQLNNNENEFKAKRISPALSTSSTNISKIQTIEDNDNDIELGEVIQLSNSTKDDSPPPNKKSLLNEDEPVTLSKKIIPFVRPRIIDWLEKCVEIAFKLTKKSNLSNETGLDLLKKSWPRLLLTYMIENSFEFCVTKDYNYNNNNNNESSNNESSTSSGNNNNSNNNDLPKEKHANELNNIISSGSSFQLNLEELDKLREFILLSEGNFLNFCFIKKNTDIYFLKII